MKFLSCHIFFFACNKMSSALSSVDTKHAVPVGAMAFALAKGWTWSQGLNVPLMSQVELGLVAGGSAVVADSVLAAQSKWVKAAATGAVLSGAMYAYRGDSNFQVYLPVGAGAYFLSNWVVKRMKSMSNTMGGGAAAAAADASASSMPEVPGM